MALGSIEMLLPDASRRRRHRVIHSESGFVEGAYQNPPLDPPDDCDVIARDI